MSPPNVQANQVDDQRLSNAIALKISLRVWLKQRQNLIVQFNSLCQLRPFKQCQDPYYLETSVLSFCQTLLGYISSGQFKMCEKLLAGIDSTQLNADLPKDFFESMKETTLVALSFSDQCAHQINADKLENGLSKLGESLACRFDLEDDLIKLYPFTLRKIEHNQTNSRKNKLC